MKNCIITHRQIHLGEQKYVGIKSKILFAAHDQTDFLALHRAVLAAPIQHIAPASHFMALDSEFTGNSFCYTPLVPVTSFEGNQSFATFTREAADYFAFPVAQRDCGPAWFKSLWHYIEHNNLPLGRVAYDLELYRDDYASRIRDVAFNFSEAVFEIVLKSTAPN